MRPDEAEIWADDVTPANFLYACQNESDGADRVYPGQGSSISPYL